MTKSRLFVVFASLAIIAVVACGQQALAQQSHRPNFKVKVLPSTRSSRVHAETTTPAGLYGLEAAFTGTPYSLGPNSDGSDLWPCFAGGTTTNPDCPSIGDPSQNFEGVLAAVLGSPAYTWPLGTTAEPGCNSNTNGTSNTTYVPCGQTETWYEDATGTGASFDLTYQIVATQVQGSATVYLVDSGLVDFGPNPYGSLGFPADVIIYGDQNLGTWSGAGAGPNNGNCTGNINYPSATKPAAGLFIEASAKTCVNPVSGLVKWTATTTVATPIYTHETTAAGCPGFSGPPYSCYKVTYSATGKKTLAQTWYTWLE
jgi:hypothetical protein